MTRGGWPVASRSDANPKGPFSELGDRRLTADQEGAGSQPNEPPNHEGISYSITINKRYRGVEPLASVWKTEVLPLYEYRDDLIYKYYAGGNLLSRAYKEQGLYETVFDIVTECELGFASFYESGSCPLEIMKEHCLTRKFNQRLEACQLHPLSFPACR